MNWWQVAVISGAVVLVGLYVAFRVNQFAFGSGVAARDVVEHLERTINSLGEIEARLLALSEDTEKSLGEVSGALETLLKPLTDADATAQQVRLIRDRIRTMDDAEQARRSLEEANQKAQEAWERAARAEADRLGKEGKP
jgi:DNA repair ATPase RecN